VLLGSLGGGVRYAFTTRSAGFSAPPFESLNLSFDVGDQPASVETNRRAVLDRLRVPHAVWLTAQHGSGVAVVGVADDLESDRQFEVDGLVTTIVDVALAALAADCALVALADPTAGVLGVVHCGRAGLTAGIVGAAVDEMRAQGASAVRAAIGPTICGRCYEVGDDVAAAVGSVVPQARSRGRNGTPALDIKAAVVAQLADAGVYVVREVGGCTLEDDDAFSYRRDHRTGRQAALIWQVP
jgi:polyphenol oxidase